MKHVRLLHIEISVNRQL